MSAHQQHIGSNEARSLTLDTDPWLSCEACFDLMDRYVETLLTDPNTVEMPEFPVHLHGCGACADETESLLLFVAAQDGIDARPALERLRPS
jgi:hypothetical protein